MTKGTPLDFRSLAFRKTVNKSGSYQLIDSRFDFRNLMFTGKRVDQSLAG